MDNTTHKIFPSINDLCQKLEGEFNIISDDRKEMLRSLSSYISDKNKRGEPSKIIVVCTHNSRRSHLGQLWLLIAADYFGVPHIETFSGGTEATALNERVVVALINTGFTIEGEASAKNPLYSISWADGMDPYVAFSKKYSDEPNPTSDFAAVMVCTEADEACPIVVGCDFRLALPFNDPKAYDDSDLEAEKYLERLHDIGREMMYVLSEVKR